MNESPSSPWQNVYATKRDNEVSWFQGNPAPSLELIDLARPTPQSAIVDIGGGASRLVDNLVARGSLTSPWWIFQRRRWPPRRRGSATTPMCDGSLPTSPHGTQRKLTTSGTTARHFTSSPIRDDRAA